MITKEREYHIRFAKGKRARLKSSFAFRFSDGSIIAAYHYKIYILPENQAPRGWVCLSADLITQFEHCRPISICYNFGRANNFK